jgi:hypothetical protein
MVFSGCSGFNASQFRTWRRWRFGSPFLFLKAISAKDTTFDGNHISAHFGCNLTLKPWFPNRFFTLLAIGHGFRWCGIAEHYTSRPPFRTINNHFYIRINPCKAYCLVGYRFFNSNKSVRLSFKFRTLPNWCNSRSRSISTSVIRIISVLGVASAFIPFVGKAKSQGVKTMD